MFDKVRRRGFALDPTCELWMPVYRYGLEQTKWWDYSGHNRHGVITGTVPVAYSMLRIASGSVTQANMKISAVAGTAFVDFSLANVLTDYLDHILVIKDSSGRAIQGYIKAAGTGETLDSTLVLNGVDFIGGPPPTSWTEYTTSVLTAESGRLRATKVAVAYLGAIQNIVQVPGRLGRFSVDLKAYTTDNPGDIRLGSSNILDDSAINYKRWATQPVADNIMTYLTEDVLTYFVISLLGYDTVGGNYIEYDNVIYQQVLTPSATGVTIVSTKMGATYNWASKDANFNYNDSSGYTYEIYQISGGIASGWYFKGVDDRVVHTAINLGKLHTLHYWIKRIGDASGMVHAGAVDYNGLRISDTTVGYSSGVGTAVAVLHNGAALTTKKTLISVIRILDKVTFYQDGVQIGLEQTMGGQPDDLTLTDIGRFSDGTIYFHGIIYEIVCFNDNKGFMGVRNYFEMTRAIQGI